MDVNTKRAVANADMTEDITGTESAYNVRNVHH